MAKIAPSLIRGYHRRHPSFVSQLVPGILSFLGTGVALEIREDLLSGRIERILDREIDPGSYRSASDFRRDYLAISLLSKFPFDGYRDEKARKAVAVEKFLLAEESCKQADRRLRFEKTVLLNGVTATSYIHVMQRKISSILGRFSWDLCEDLMGFGPGASTRLPRKKADAYYKLGGIPEVTYRCGDLATLLVSRIPPWEQRMRSETGSPLSRENFSYVKGNRITTVPKNAKTERVIAIEPDMNLWVQKGLGSLIRKRLRDRSGIDLNSQVGNQELALLGSRDGTLATIDLASASDSISLQLCKELLPPDWASAIEHCRSPKGSLPDGTEVLYRKVSSMGNGFTFELETLIFYAACLAVRELHPGIAELTGRPLLVYGDDIVIESRLAPYLVDLLAYLGFETNRKKTFIEGPFRESCGKHYFLGSDVTPFYIREDIDNVQRLFWLHNQFIHWLVREHGTSPAYIGEEEQRVLDAIVSAIPKQFRNFCIPYGLQGSPDDFGDIGLVKRFDESRPRMIYFGSYEARGITTSVQQVQKDDTGFLVRQLYTSSKMRSVGWEAWGSGIPARDRLKVVKPIVFQWSDPFVRVDYSAS